MIKLFEWVKNNFYLFGTTAFPGVHKIVLLFVVNLVFSLEITADFINDIFILYLLGYLTVFNWANFILSDMMKLHVKRRRVFFGKISVFSLVINLPLLLLVFGLFHWRLLTDCIGFSVLLISWSYQQLWRHYMIANHNYCKLFYADLAVLFFAIVSIWLTHKIDGNVYLLMSFPTIIVPIFFEKLPFILPDFKWNRRIFRRLLNYTLINLSTGGIQLIFAPLSHQLLSADFTRVIGFANNIAAMVLLIPRAMAYRYLPALSANFRSSDEKFQRIYNEFGRKVNIAVVGMVIFGFILLSIALVLFDKSAYLLMAFGLVVYVNLLVGQLAIPSSNVLLVRSQSGRLLQINIFSFVLIIMQMILVLLSNMDSVLKMLIILSFSIMVGLLRYIYLLIYMKRTL